MFHTSHFYIPQALAFWGLMVFSVASFAYGTPTYFSFVSNSSVGTHSTFLGMFVVQEVPLIDGHRYGVQNFSTTADGIYIHARSLAEIYDAPTEMGTFSPDYNCSASCWSFKSNTFLDRGVQTYYTLTDQTGDQALLSLYDASTNARIGNSSSATVTYSSGPVYASTELAYQAYVTANAIGAPEIDGSLTPKVGFLLGCLFLMFGRKKQAAEPILTV